MDRALRPATNARGVLLRRSRAMGMAICCTALLSANSQPPHPVTQSDVGAVYLYNFGNSVTWPPETAPASMPFSICTLGGDDFNGALDALTSNESLQGQRTVVRNLSSIANTALQTHLAVSSELLRVAVAAQGAPPEGSK